MIRHMVMGTGLLSSAPAASSAVFYRFEDANGRVHIVDSIDLVPQALRGQAAHVQYNEETSVNGLPASPALAGWQAFALGVGAALLVVFLFRRLPGSLKLVLRLGIMAGVGALAVGAYFGWMRRTTHQSGDALAGPGALLDDAKSAVEKMNARMRVQQEQLKEIEQTK